MEDTTAMSMMPMDNMSMFIILMQSGLFVCGAVIIPAIAIVIMFPLFARTIVLIRGGKMEYKYFKLMDDRKVIEYYRIWPNGTYQWWDEEKGVWHPGSHKTWEDKCFCVEKNALVVLEETSPLEMVVLLGSEVEGMFE